MKYVLITGVSGGMGIKTALKFIENNFFVYGLDVNEPKSYLSNFRFIKTNLRDINSINDAFNIIKEDNNKLDAIIHMAGIYDFNSLVEMSEEEFIKIFDINVFANYRINKTFLPLLVDKGKIIIVSSELAATDPLPFTGIYGITKSTIEKYAYSLRMELQLINKQVIVIRPGAIATTLLDKSIERINAFKDSTTYYQESSKKYINIINKIEGRKIPPERIALLAYKIANKKKAKYVYKINRNPLLLLFNVLPDRLENYIIRKILTK